jgi:hypothetical protein
VSLLPVIQHALVSQILFWRGCSMYVEVWMSALNHYRKH